MAESSERELTADEAAYVDAARDKAFILYEGTRTPHRSCGIALAETFSLPTPAYQSLRRGGITGKGTCGAIRAGEQVLGELLGDPSPTGVVTPELRAAVTWYQDAWRARMFANQAAPDIVCDSLVRPHGDFMGPARKKFCTNLAADVAALTAEALCRFGSSRPPIESGGDPMKLSKEQVAAVVAEAGKKMSDPNYSAVLVGGFVQSQTPVAQFISAHERDLGGAEQIVNVIFHCALVAQCYARNGGRVRTVSYEDLDAAARGEPLVRLEEAQLPVHEFIMANVENVEAQKLIAMIALAIDSMS